MRDWQDELTAEWRRESAKRWDRRSRGPGSGVWLVALAALAAVVAVVAVVAVIVTGDNTPEPEVTLAATTPAQWRLQTLVAPPPPPIVQAVEAEATEEDEEEAPSEVDALWSQVQTAREDGDVGTLLGHLRAIIQRHPDDARTPEAALGHI